MNETLKTWCEVALGVVALPFLLVIYFFLAMFSVLCATAVFWLPALIVVGAIGACVSLFV